LDKQISNTRNEFDIFNSIGGALFCTEERSRMAATIVVDKKLAVDFPDVTETKFKYIDKSFVKKHEDVYNTKKDLKVFVGSAAKASFLGHKAVLQDAHEFFGNSFCKEGEEGSEIYFKEITAYGFTPIFEYFYHGYIYVDPELFTELIEAASFFKIEWILDVCRHFMLHFYGVIKYSYTIELAERFGFEGFKEEMCGTFGLFLAKLAKGDAPFKDYPEDLLSDFLQGNYYTKAPEFLILQVKRKTVALRNNIYVD
jgi:kelch-like protein 9/13